MSVLEPGSSWAAPEGQRRSGKIAWGGCKNRSEGTALAECWWFTIDTVSTDGAILHPVSARHCPLGAAELLAPPYSRGPKTLMSTCLVLGTAWGCGQGNARGQPPSTLPL